MINKLQALFFYNYPKVDIWESICKRVNDSTVKMMDKKDELSERQKNSLNALTTANTEYIKILDDLMVRFQKNITPLESQSEKFWKIVDQLDKAHSQYPMGQYAHYYFKGFENATEPFMDGWGNKNNNYWQITEEAKEIIEKQFPNYDNFNRLLQ